MRAQETDTTLLMRRWKNTTRLYKNKVAVDASKVEKESKSGEFAEIAPYVSGKRGKEVFVNGDVEFGVSLSVYACELLVLITDYRLQVWTTGQVIGLIHDIPTCDVLVKRIENEAETALKERLALLKPESKL